MKRILSVIGSVTGAHASNSVNHDDMSHPGRFHALDDMGYIINDTTPYRTEAWDEVVDFALGEVKQNSVGFHSCYLRGSVARGTVVGTVDLDMVVVYKKESAKLGDRSWVTVLDKEIAERFPICSGLDLNFAEISVLIQEPRGDDYRFTLKTQSICLAGEDIIPQLPNFRPRGNASGKARLEGRTNEEADPASGK